MHFAAFDVRVTSSSKQASMLLSPALVALKSLLPFFLGPPFCFYIILRAFSFPLPTIISVAICLASIPGATLIAAAWRRHIARKEAKKHGAVLAPWVEDGSWLGIGVVYA